MWFHSRRNFVSGIQLILWKTAFSTCRQVVMSREVFHLGYLLVLKAVDPGPKFTSCSVTLTTAPRRDTKDKILFKGALLLFDIYNISKTKIMTIKSD